MEDIHNLNLLWNRRINDWCRKEKVHFTSPTDPIETINYENVRQADFYKELIQCTNNFKYLADLIVDIENYKSKPGGIWYPGAMIYKQRLGTDIMLLRVKQDGEPSAYTLWYKDKEVLSLYFNHNDSSNRLGTSFVGLNMIMIEEDKPLQYHCNVLVDKELNFNIDVINKSPQKSRIIYAYDYDIQEIQKILYLVKMYFNTLDYHL